MQKETKRWKDVYHYGFGYTACPYCGDETEWYNPASQRPQSDLKTISVSIVQSAEIGSMLAKVGL